MENTYRSELECLVCLDLIIEPVTTVCGHTFCKICLIRNLKSKLNCPMCREPILQSGETMKKNVVMENLIKSNFRKEYEEKLKAKKLAYESEIVNSDPAENSHFSFPSIKIRGNFIWPGQVNRFKLEDPLYLNTLRVVSVNDRNLVLIPYEDFVNKICCLCELQNITFDQEGNSATFDLVGKIRFKTAAIQNLNMDPNNANSSTVCIATGELIKDSQVTDEEKKAEILNKLKDIDFINGEILHNTTYSVLLNLNKKFGNLPKLNLNTINSNTAEANSKLFESISFYYLNVVKSSEKKELYQTTDVLQRINWVHEKFKNIANLLDNQSLSLNFYDLDVAGQPKDHLLYMILVILSFIMLGIAYKMKWIHLD